MFSRYFRLPWTSRAHASETIEPTFFLTSDYPILGDRGLGKIGTCEEWAKISRNTNSAVIRGIVSRTIFKYWSYNTVAPNIWDSPYKAENSISLW